MDDFQFLEKSEFCEEAEKLLHWYEWKKNEPVFTNKNIDVREITTLLLIMGFDLESLKRVERIEKTKNKCCTLRIEVNCSNSGLSGILTKNITNCFCPSNENKNPNDVTLPTVTHFNKNNTAVRGLLSRAFTIINESDTKNDFQALNVISDCHLGLDLLNDIEDDEGGDSKGMKRNLSSEDEDKTAPLQSSNFNSRLNQMTRDCKRLTIKKDSHKKAKAGVDEILSASFQSFVISSSTPEKENIIDISNQFEEGDKSWITTENDSAIELKQVSLHKTKDNNDFGTTKEESRCNNPQGSPKYVLKSIKKRVLRKCRIKKKHARYSVASSLSSRSSHRISEGIEPGTSGLHLRKDIKSSPSS